MHDIDLIRKSVTVELHTQLSLLEKRIEANETAFFIPSEIREQLDFPHLSMDARRHHYHKMQGPKHSFFIRQLVKGGGALISFRKISKSEFFCEMDFRMYPFHNINCKVEIKSDRKNLKFIAEDISVADKFVFNFNSDYEMRFQSSLKFKFDDEKNPVIGLIIGLKYRPLEAILVHYFPALIMVSLGFLSFFLPTSESSYRISLVSLVILGLLNQFNCLTMTAPKGRKGSSAAAIYLLACLLNSTRSLFLNVMVIRYDDVILEKKVNFYSGVLNASLFILFNILYWTAVISSVSH